MILDRLLAVGRVDETAPKLLVLLRLVVALVQGVLLYLLFRAARDEVWPATDPYVFLPAALVAMFVPLIVISAAGRMRFWTLGAWKATAFLVLIGIGLHAADRMPEDGGVHGSFGLWLFSAAGLFIAHVLVLAADEDRRAIARYSSYFDLAWKHIIQVALAGTFAGAFWLLFALANALFQLIDIDLLDDLLERAWFVIPVSALVAAFAIHITDVHSGIVRGLRNLGLTLLSWLLVMMTALMVAFLLALPFTGLQPLWEQKSATGILLVCAASLIVLINAAYRDGARDQPVQRVIRFASWAAAVALLPMVALAAYALWLRVDQYGFTPERVAGVACVAVAAAYALGYACSLAKPGPWLAALERTNLVVSFLILAILLALFSPVADPARISVADQMKRLESGAVTPEMFDYNFLRFHGARYGIEALKALAASEDKVTAQRADAALKKSHRREPTLTQTPADLARRITVYPAGASLPDSFLKQDWRKSGLDWWPCFMGEGECEAFIIDLDGAGAAEIVLAHPDNERAAILQSTADGFWTLLGYLNPSGCEGMRKALREGAFKLIEPRVKDIEIGGRRFYLDERHEACRK